MPGSRVSRAMPGSRVRPSFRDVFLGFPRPSPGRPGDPGLFGPGSAVWKVNREAVTILGGGRALLMQIAHPMVAAGVADHSDFDRDAYARLWRTLGTVLTVVFGDSEQARSAAELVAGIHSGVVGTRGGDAYRALDPELLLWVHATLVDSALISYERFVGTLPAALREDYYQEMKRFAGAFGLSEADIPDGLEAFKVYLDRSVAMLEISADALRLVPGILRPPGPLALAPASAMLRFVTIGLLPPRFREGFGLGWGPVRERALATLAASVRGGRPLFARTWRLWPHAVQAERRSVANVR